MTTPEHTLVGIHAAMAFGIHRRFGWSIIVFAGIASNLPDWDGLPMLVDMTRFESGHRVWGHNLLSILCCSVLFAWFQYRFRWIESLAVRLQKYFPADVKIKTPDKDASFVVLFLVCFVVQLIHLPCDMVVSGGSGLSDWPIQPFWPISHIGFVFPLIPWGDIGPTLILMFGVILLSEVPNATFAFVVNFVVGIGLLSVCSRVAPWNSLTKRMGDVNLNRVSF